MSTVLYIKRSQQLLLEQNIQRDFNRFLQDGEKRRLREIVEDSSLGEMLSEDIVNILRDEREFQSPEHYNKLFEFAALLNKRWNKKQLEIYTIDRMEYHSDILNALNEWSSCAGLEFSLTDDISSSDIRISFERNSGHWSYIGREVEHNSLAGKATINFDPADFELIDSTTRYGIVLHEIGHSLGLIHEHQKENSPIIWNKHKVYRDCLYWFQWSAEKVDHNIFNSFNSNELFYSKEFDIDSIMIYALPLGWSSNYEINTINTRLSEMDKRFTKAYYSVL